MKGVSPLIAGVLLVVITVAVSIIVLPFVTQYAQQTSEEASEASLAITDCALEQLSIKSVWIDTYRNRVRALTVAGGQSDIVIKSSAGLDSSGVSCVSNASQVIGKGSQQVIELDCAVYDYDCSDFDRVLVTSSCGKTYTYTLAPSSCTGPTVIFSGNATGIEVNLTNETANSLVFNIEVEGEGSGYADVTIDVDDASKDVFKNDSGTIIEILDCGTEPCILSRDVMDNTITLRIPIGDPQFFVSSQQLTWLNDWWDSDWSYRTPVTVKNENDTKTLAEGYTVSTSFNLTGCIQEGKCLLSGNDTRVAWLNGSTEQEIDRILEPSSALSFDGINDYVDAGNDSSLNFGDGNFTVSVWVKTTSTPSEQMIFAKYDPNEIYGYVYMAHSPSSGAYFEISDMIYSGPGVRSSTRYDDGLWHNFVGVRDGDLIKLYVDGVKKGEEDCSFVGNIDNYNNAAIGTILVGPTTGVAFFNGIIDEVAIFNRSLSAEEISQLYNNGTAIPLEITGVSTSGLVGLWHFDEGYGDIAQDTSGNNNDGAITNAFWTKGSVVPESVSADAALVLDGVDDYVDAGNDSSLNFGTGDFTLSAWIKNQKGNPTIINKMKPANVGYYLYISSETKGTVELWVTDGTNSATAEGVTKINDDTWQFISAVRNSTNVAVYINGVLDAEADASAVGNISNGGPVWLGSYYGDWFSGSIDEVAIWNRSLSAEEIASMYNSGQPIEPDTSTVLLMHFDDRQTVTEDSSGSGNHGTLKNGAYFTGGYFTSQKNNTLWFKTQANVSTVDSDYSIYYGNPTASEPTIDLNNVFPYAGGAAGAWHFEPADNALMAEDSSGNNNTGLLGNGNTTEAPKLVEGKFGWALEFDGADDFVGAGNDSSLNFGSSDFTIASWVKLPEEAPNTPVVIKERPAPDIGYMIYFGGAYAAWFKFYIYVFPDYYGVKTIPSVSPNTWYHVVAVHDVDKIAIYLNGILGEEKNIPSLNTDHDKPLYIGAYPEWGWYFNGAIDEVTIYPRALTPEEISAMYIYPDPTTALASAQSFPVI